MPATAWGMLFLDETRMMSSNPEGMAQFENLVRRDRNHPCVFMWNMGNEERESQTDVGLRMLTAMKAAAYRLDGSRPVTVAPPPLGFDLGKGGLAVSDVMGYNYADPQIEAFHKANPKIPCLGTENVSAVATRGIYTLDPEHGYTSSYDPYTTTGRASAEGWWRFANARAWMPGGFVWTGFDYRGEPSPYQWPNTGSQYGVLDTCGFPKDTYFYYRAWWQAEPVLHIFPHWNWPGLEGKLIAVWVHTNMDRVELFQDGVSLGAKDVPKDSHVAWNVTYRPGVLEARGFQGGRQVMVQRRGTTGPAAKLVLTADRQQLAADGKDLAFCTVAVQDVEGRVLPVTDQAVTFSVSGSGVFKGSGNGDPTSHESDLGITRRAFSGLCMGIVQALKTAGTLQVEVSSPGLTSASLSLPVGQVTLEPQVSVWQRVVPTGSGITGLWRPAAPERLGSASVGFDPLQADVAGDTLYTFIQNGSHLTGALEAPPTGFGPGGGAVGGPLQGSVEGNRVSFRVGTATYTGTVTSDRMELRRATPPRPGAASPRPAEAGPALAIGPPPEGSDPSLGSRSGGAPPSILLRRVQY